MRGLLAVALAKRVGERLTVEMARAIAAETAPERAVADTTYLPAKHRGDLVFQVEQLGPRPDAGELAAQRMRFLRETLPASVQPNVQWDELRQLERSGQLLILTMRRGGQLQGSVWLSVYQDINTGECVACDDMLFVEPDARGSLAVVQLWRYAEGVLEQLGVRQMSCHSREANHAGRLARFMGWQVSHTGFSKRIGSGQERARRARKD